MAAGLDSLGLSVFPSLRCSSFAEMFPCWVYPALVFSGLLVTMWRSGVIRKPQRGTLWILHSRHARIDLLFFPS